jgi:hypothetical protein
MEPEFPLEIIVMGTPVSFQRRRPKAKGEWKSLVATAARSVLPEMHFATKRSLAVTLYYFPDEPMEGDVDNIVKLTLDGMARLVYLDDAQIERVVVQKFEPGRVVAFANPSDVLTACMLGEKPALYIRVSADPHEEIRA